MNNRNHTLDLTKGILAIYVIYIHIGTFVIKPENLSGINLYLRSVGSAVVPLFFMMSGYFFYKSKNKTKNVNKLLLIYFFYATITYFLVYEPGGYLGYLFKMDQDIGYLWFVKYLLVYQMVLVLFIDNDKVSKNLNKIFYIFLVMIAIAFTFSTLNTDVIILKDRGWQFVYFLEGFIIGALNLQYKKITSVFILLILLVPYVNNMKYDTFCMALNIIVVLVFIGLNSLEIKRNPLKMVSKNTLNILFVQYFVIQIVMMMGRINYDGTLYIMFCSNFYVMFLYVLINTLALILLKEKFVKLTKAIFNSIADVLRSFGDSSPSNKRIKHNFK